QANPDGSSTPSVAEPVPTSPSSSTEPGGPGPSTEVVPDELEAGGLPTTTTSASPHQAEQDTPLGFSSVGNDTRTGLLVVLVLVFVGAVYVAAVVALRRSVRRRRREQARNASAAVVVAWRELLEHLALLGIRQGRTETPEELAARAEPYLDDLA